MGGLYGHKAQARQKRNRSREENAMFLLFATCLHEESTVTSDARAQAAR
jgi:hypothetical protein